MISVIFCSRVKDNPPSNVRRLLDSAVACTSPEERARLEFLIKYDGDSQPLGYAIFDEGQMRYNERLDKPTSTANPDEDFSGVDATTQRFLSKLVLVVGTPHFAVTAGA